MTCASIASTRSPAAAKTIRLSPGAAFYLLGSITVSFLAGSLAPTPLYPIYQAAWGFSALTVTEVFGIYALALLGSLLVIGRLSDHVGRRPVVITAILAQVIAMLMFATAGSVNALMMARVVQGIATGAALAAVGAAMLDLDKVRGPVANAVSPPLGTGTGGLVAGLVVYYLPAPTQLIYVALAGVFLIQALGVALMPETVSRRVGVVASLTPRFRLPGDARLTMLLATPILVAGWALAGFYASLAPGLMRVVFGRDPSLFSGFAALALAGSAAVSVWLLRNSSPRVVMGYGAFALLTGVAVVIWSLDFQSAPGFFFGTSLAGTGFGAGFQGAMRTVLPAAKAHERAGVLSVIFVISYLAMALPAVIAGFFISHGGQLFATAQCFGIVVIVLAAFALLGVAIGARRRG